MNRKCRKGSCLQNNVSPVGRKCETHTNSLLIYCCAACPNAFSSRIYSISYCLSLFRVLCPFNTASTNRDVFFHVSRQNGTTLISSAAGPGPPFSFPNPIYAARSALPFILFEHLLACVQNIRFFPYFCPELLLFRMRDTLLVRCAISSF